MSAPQFQFVIFAHQDKLRVFSLTQKSWQPLEGVYDVADAPSEEMKAKLQGHNVLVIVSDTYCGHLQLNQENKKSKLNEAAIKQLLEEEYDIDTDAYELNWHNFTLTRQSVQISVSGVEQEFLEKMRDWIVACGAKKAWLMPFAWFVSTLKSVDPALIAVLIDDEIHISHHYLGIDDARVVGKEDLAKYVAVRQRERKETHLLYLQAPSRRRKGIEKTLQEVEISLQPLLPESGDDSLRDIVQAVLTQHADALSELLHLEMEFGGEEAVAAAAAAPATDLPRPQLPPNLRSAPQTEDAASPIEETVDEETVPEEPETSEAPAAAAEPEEDTELAADLEDTEAAEATSLAAAASVVEKLQETSTTPTAEAIEAVEPEEATVVSPAASAQSAAAHSVTSEEVISEALEETPLMESPEEDKTEQVIASLRNTGGVQTHNQQRYAEMEKKRSWKGPVLVFFLVMAMTAIIGGAIVASEGSFPQIPGLNSLMAQYFPSNAPAPSPSPSPSPSPVATLEPASDATSSAQPSPATNPTVDKETLKVVILNATGVNGLAGQVRAQLLKAGWESVAVGNATGSYNDATFVMADDETVIPVLEEDLERDLTVSDSIEEARASQYDIVIVLGEE